MKKRTDSVVRTLREAWRLINKPEHWIKGAFHRGDCHCANGAVNAIGGRGREGAWRALENTVKATSDKQSNQIAYYNDLATTTHEDVKRWFRRAIAYRQREIKGRSSREGEISNGQ